VELPVEAILNILEEVSGGWFLVTFIRVRYLNARAESLKLD
jgi:hypothetical protein